MDAVLIFSTGTLVPFTDTITFVPICDIYMVYGIIDMFYYALTLSYYTD